MLQIRCFLVYPFVFAHYRDNITECVKIHYQCTQPLELCRQVWEYNRIILNLRYQFLLVDFLSIIN